LLPVVVTLLLGFFAAWRHDFDATQATTLNRMVFRYALPLSLFVTTLSASLDELVAQLPLAVVIAIAMMASFLAVLVNSGDRAGTKPKAQTLISDAGRALRAPVVWAPILAIVLVLAGIHFPKPISGSLYLLGQANGGVALFATGIVLYSRRVAISLPLCVSVFAKNIALPVAVWGVLVAFNLPHETIREAALTLALPTATITVILAVQYAVAEQEMASTLFVSTILSPLTMGAFIWLLA